MREISSGNDSRGVGHGGPEHWLTRGFELGFKPGWRGREGGMGGICCLTILCDSASSKGEKLALLAGQYQRSLSTNQVQNAFEVVGLGE